MGYTRQRRALRGMGDFSMDTACSDIPAGDPYRAPPNYCTQPSGNVIMFNADGSVPPDPFATGGGSSSGSGGGKGIFDTIAGVIGTVASGFAPKPPSPVMPPKTGMSTTTKVAIAGGAVLALAIFARRK